MLRSTSFTKDYYEEHRQAGVDYLVFGEWQREYGRWLVESLELGNRAVLDVGCACGAILRGLREAGAVAQGIDVSEHMIRLGRQQWPDTAPYIHTCDALNLHLYTDGLWDWLHCAQVAEHWKPHHVQPVLRELGRVTKAGGLFFCCLDTEELMRRQAPNALRDDPTHYTIRPLAWWHERLEETGWSVCTAEFAEALRNHPLSFLKRYDWDWFIARKTGRGPGRDAADPLQAEFQLCPTTSHVDVDLAHAAFLAGAIAALKPDRVLELGIGTGYSTRAILQALAWNRRGALTAVDNWHDWQGREPGHVQALRDAGVSVVEQSEEEYVRACPSAAFDYLLADADHLRSDQWVEEHLRIVRNNGFLFWHDTANPDFPNLANIEKAIKAKGLPYYHFRDNSRPGERCDRGLLFAVNRKVDIAWVSAWDEGAEALAAVTWPQKEVYCRKHGYTAIGRKLKLERAPIWAPWWLAIETLPQHDWVCMADVDLVVMDTNRRLEELLLPPPVDLIASYDVNGLNAGVVFLRNTPWANELLRKVWGSEPRYRAHPSPEQSALAHLLYQEPQDKWKVVSQKAFNCYDYSLYPGLDYPEGQYQPGDFILHLPGLANDKRKEILKQRLEGVRA